MDNSESSMLVYKSDIITTACKVICPQKPYLAGGFQTPQSQSVRW